MHYLSRRKLPISLEIVQTLVDKVPELLAKETPQTKNAISAAFGTPCSDDVLLYFAERHPVNNKSLCISFGVTITAEKAEQLRRLLPHLTRLSIDSREEAKIHQVLSVLHHFEEGSKVIKLKIHCRKVVTSTDLSINITVPLRSLLHSANNPLQHLSVVGFLTIDWPVLYDIFRTNRNLLSLTIIDEVSKKLPKDLSPLVEIIERHNTTLQELKLNRRKPKGYRQLQYLCLVNRYGRGMARELTDMNMADLLIAANTMTGGIKNPFDRCNVYYGLLRESPGLWSQIGH
jgi:hypothetical protein